MKKLQVALDLFSVEHALEVLEHVGEFVDIIEMGTPLVIAEGARAIRTVKEKYPDKIVFADIKVMDGGSEVPRSVVEAGCDMFSVLAAAADKTLESAIAYAKEHDVKVLVDMCNISNMEERGKQVERLNPDYICCHVAYDLQATGVNPVEELKRLSEVNIPKAIAGGIRLDTFKDAVNSDADVVISGGGIYNQKDMRETARQMRALLDEYNRNH